MELKRCNSFSDVEDFAKTLPGDKLITVWSNHQYYFIEEGILCLPGEPVYQGKAEQLTTLSIY